MAKEKSLAERKESSLRRKNALIGYTFILPNFLGFAIFILIPVVFTLVLSIMDWDGFNAMKFVGFGNFEEIFTDYRFSSAFWKRDSESPLSFAAILRSSLS